MVDGRLERPPRLDEVGEGVSGIWKDGVERIEPEVEIGRLENAPPEPHSFRPCGGLQRYKGRLSADPDSHSEVGHRERAVRVTERGIQRLEGQAVPKTERPEPRTHDSVAAAVPCGKESFIHLGSD